MAIFHSKLLVYQRVCFVCEPTFHNMWGPPQCVSKKIEREHELATTSLVPKLEVPTICNVYEGAYIGEISP